jgi:hypothetical protein
MPLFLPLGGRGGERGSKVHYGRRRRGDRRNGRIMAVRGHREARNRRLGRRQGGELLGLQKRRRSQGRKRGRQQRQRIFRRRECWSGAQPSRSPGVQSQSLLLGTSSWLKLRLGSGVRRRRRTTAGRPACFGGGGGWGGGSREI